MTPQPIPDPDAAISEAQAIRKALSEFHAIAVAHDPHGAATHADDVQTELFQVATLQKWLRHYSDALRGRALRQHDVLN